MREKKRKRNVLPNVALCACPKILIWNFSFNVANGVLDSAATIYRGKSQKKASDVN